MKTKLTPLAKGLITGLLMVIAFWIPHFQNQTERNIFYYIVWVILGAGIVWTLIEFPNSPAYASKFGAYFKEGFRCFIVAILLLIIGMMVFYSTNPQYRERDAKKLRTEMENKRTATGQPQYLPKEIDAGVAVYKKYYIISIISVSIFGYLILGSVITASGSVILLSRKK
jgi:hypothetical protein